MEPFTKKVLVRFLGSIYLFLAYSAICCLSGHAHAQEVERFMHEAFNSLQNWKPLPVDDSPPSEYTIAAKQGQSVLAAKSKGTISAITYQKTFNLNEFPYIRWRWMIENVYQKGDVNKEATHDFPIRVYLLFKYLPEKASMGLRFKYSAAKKILGEYPPHSCLSYFWANRKHSQKIITSPYTDRYKEIVLQAGAEKVGKWQIQQVNALADYRTAFGEVPPEIATLAIMNDSDNTKEASTAYVDFIEVFRSIKR